MKGKKVNTLYIFQGSLTDDVAVSMPEDVDSLVCGIYG